MKGIKLAPKSSKKLKGNIRHNHKQAVKGDIVEQKQGPKGKRGPKPKGKKERIKPYSIGLSKVDITFLKEQAKIEGITVGAYIRALIDIERDKA